MIKKMKHFSKLVVVFVASFLLSACGTSQSTTGNSSSEASKSSTAQEITITDATGEVTLTGQPKKIVVLDNGVADTIRALGYEDTIVGMPTDSLPSYLSELGEQSSVQNVGNLKEVNLETIDSLEPDLIIASGRTASQVEEFKKIALTIYFAIDTADYWNSVKTNISEISKVFGEEGEQKAATELEKLETEIKMIADKNKDTNQTALTIMLNEGNMAGVSENGRFSIIYQALGFKPTSLAIEESRRGSGRQGEQNNTSGSETSSQKNQEKGSGGGNHGAGLSFESVSEINPDLIFVIDRSMAIGGDTSVNDVILQNELIQGTNAAKKNNIVNLTADLWYLSGGGLESTHLMIKELSPYAGGQ